MCPTTIFLDGRSVKTLIFLKSDLVKLAIRY